MTKNTENTENTSPYKDVEFKAFIGLIKQGQHAHWGQIATALGVENDTITRWKKTPEAQEAISDGISHALERMQQSGSKDWRMWETKLKLLGINTTNKIDVTSGGEKLNIAMVEFVDGDNQNSDKDS